MLLWSEQRALLLELFFKSLPSILLCTTLFLLLFCQNAVDGVHVFDVYRMFQLEKSSAPFGSQKGLVNFLATVPSSLSHSLDRQILLVKWDNLSLELLDIFVTQKGASAILVVLPRDLEISKEQLKNWSSLERKLLKLAMPIPIYFTKEDNFLLSVYQEMEQFLQQKNPSDLHQFSSLLSWLPLSDDYQLVANHEPTIVGDASIASYQAWLNGYSSKQALHELPTIVISSYYDSFSVAPGLANGCDSNASGMVALLELMRLFSKLYHNPKTQGRYNLLFLMNGAGRLDFAGTKHCLSGMESSRLEKVEFALCLDSIGEDIDKLFLHVSKPPKEDSSQGLFQRLQDSAKQLHVSLGLVHKKINISSSDVFWEHEQFSRKRVPGATLSNLAQAGETFSRSNLFDQRERLNCTILVRNIRLIAESLAKHIYNLDEKHISLFEGSLDINEAFVESWLNAVCSVSRAIGGSSSQDEMNMMKGIGKVLEMYAHGVSNQTFPMEPSYTFYDTSAISMTAYKVKPAMFDLLLTVIVTCYLVILYAALKGPTELYRQIRNSFTATKGKSALKKKQ
jgi:hypothetical protein